MNKKASADFWFGNAGKDIEEEESDEEEEEDE